jgi:hypothetical protein
MELLSGFGKRGVELGLLTKKADILDTEFLSKYFVLQEFYPQLTAGKNSVTFNGSELLKKGGEILVECIDSAGKPLYIEAVTKLNSSYKESSGYILSIQVFNETSNGAGKLILYGTTTTGASVKWIGNIIIDKTKQNSSTVRFYTSPTLEVQSLLSPLIANSDQYTSTVNLTGSFYSYAANPQKDDFLTHKRNVDIDYRIYASNFPVNTVDPSGSINSQIVGNTITLYVESIQEPYTGKNTAVSFTSSCKVKDVLNNTTIKLSDPISYKDRNNNDVIVNVSKGTFNVDYQYIVYNTGSTENYVKVEVEIQGIDPLTNLPSSSYETKDVKNSYANIVYRNLKTFSGFISRHKLYKKSLFSPGDFEIIADEPLSPYELLQDKNTSNKAFDKLGYFYNQSHIDQYVISSSNKLTLISSSNKLIEGMDILYNGNNSELTTFDNYIIFKNNAGLDRTSKYIAFDQTEFTDWSGSSYDCNFLEVKKDVNYILSVNAIVRKDSTTVNDIDASLDFYFTSSILGVNTQQNSIHSQPGLLKLGSVSAYQSISEQVYNKPIQMLFSSNCDLYGTLVIIPYKCTATISKLSVKPYGDYGFSPDVLITKIPFPVKNKNESFEIKAELFDINSNVVYSNLRTISTFDKDGESLYLYIPGLKDPTTTSLLKGSLLIKGGLEVGDNALFRDDITVEKNVILSGIEEADYKLPNRLLTLDGGDNSIKYTNINDMDHDGNDEVTVNLFTKSDNTDDITTLRLIPSVKGSNKSVLQNGDVIVDGEKITQTYNTTTSNPVSLPVNA